jgi:hypothetical protein
LYSFHLLVCSPDPETVTFRTISETMHGMLDPLGQTKLHRARFESDAPLPRAGQIEGSISFQSRGENQTELRMTVNTNVTDLAVDSGSPQVKPEVDGESHPSIFKMRTSAKLGVEDLVEAKKNPLAWLEDDPDAKPVERGERQARTCARAKRSERRRSERRRSERRRELARARAQEKLPPSASEGEALFQRERGKELARVQERASASAVESKRTSAEES